MASSMVLKATCLATMMCMVSGLVTLTQAAPTCGQVQTTVSACIAYLKGSGSEVPRPCCYGIKKMNNQAKTTPDRQSVCKCIKTTAQSLKGLNLDKLAGLPGKCGVNLLFKLSPFIDCNKIK